MGIFGTTKLITAFKMFNLMKKIIFDLNDIFTLTLDIYQPQIDFFNDLLLQSNFCQIKLTG